MAGKKNSYEKTWEIVDWKKCSLNIGNNKVVMSFCYNSLQLI